MLDPRIRQQTFQRVLQDRLAAQVQVLLGNISAHAPADEGCIALVSSAWAARPEPMVA